jgi:hypothetical protein
MEMQTEQICLTAADKMWMGFCFALLLLGSLWLSNQWSFKVNQMIISGDSFTINTLQLHKYIKDSQI